jgi:hypothetical protein
MQLNSKTSYPTIGFFTLLEVLFITLKLTGVIDWRWVWVLAPLWGQVAILVLVFAIVGAYVCYHSKDLVALAEERRTLNTTVKTDQGHSIS